MDEKHIEELTSNVQSVEKKQKSGKIIFFIIIILVLMTAGSLYYFALPKINLSEFFSSETTGDNLKTYQNSKYDFKIKYPLDWTKASDNSGDFSVVFMRYNESVGDFDATFMVTVFNLDENQKKMDISSFMEDKSNQRQQNEPGYQIIESKSTALLGSKAHKIIYYTEANGKRLKNTDIGVIKDKFLYIVNYNSYESEYNRLLMTFTEILDTFEVNGVKVSDYTQFTSGSSNESGSSESPIITANQTQIQCNELWNCTEWEECYNFTQNRTCIDINKCPSPIKKPIESRDCCSWTCTNWSECHFHSEMTNVQVRSCEPDNKSCKFDINIKPLTSRFCNYTNPCTDTEKNTSYIERGSVTDKNGVIWKDVCENITLLIEYSCEEDGDTNIEEHPCEDPTPYCESGKCVLNLSDVSEF